MKIMITVNGNWNGDDKKDFYIDKKWNKKVILKSENEMKMMR